MKDKKKVILCDDYGKESYIPEVEKGIRTSKRGKLTYANYQESRLRHWHRTIDKYIAKGPFKP